MADSGGTGSSGPWWKSLTNSRKKSKEAAEAQPPAPPALGESAPPSPDWTGGARENQHPNVLGGAGEPHKPDKSGDKSGSSRRNLKVSRSGRFKEKRKVRATLLPDGGVGSAEEAELSGNPPGGAQ